jgi:putative transposase
MPSKSVIRIYVQDGIYHIYNRGVEKRKIFLGEQDYRMFLYFLKRYLVAPEDLQGLNPYISKRGIKETNLYKEIRLLCYCLMPNHFHLMLKQLTKKGVVDFMKRVSNAYTEYFNKKYKRTGSLFQGRYKAVLVDSEHYLLHLSRYIHANPRELSKNIQDFRKYSYSSYLDYLGDRHTQWVHPQEILNYFEKQKGDLGGDEFSSYQNFVETYSEDEEHRILKNLTLE